MSHPQDVVGFDPNDYVRPGDAWICGGAADGLPCPRGPSPDGQCGAVCTPFRDGNRYFCASPSLLTGACDDGPREDGECSQIPAQCAPVLRGGRYLCTRGSCSMGPSPTGECSRAMYICRPVRTIMSRRRIVSLSVSGLALAAVAILVGGPTRKAAVSPGPVTASHMAVTDDCSACHEQGDGTAIDWIDAAASGSSRSAQIALCLKCHEELAPNAVSPHSLPPDLLRAISERTSAQNNGPLMARAVHATVPIGEELACAACHREHHGVDHDLSELADQQCQVCHKNTFHSFDRGHPDFTEYPFERRAGIRFDHATHYRVHFGNFERIVPTGTPPGAVDEIAAASSTTCLECHVQDASGTYMGVRGYETMCASCHEAQIVEDDSAVVPPIDVLSLAALAEESGDDPVRPFAATDTLFPPIMKLLLSADPEFREAYATMATGPASLGEEAAVDPENRSRLMDAAGRLLEELANDPIPSVRNRLQTALEDEAAGEAMAASAQFRPGGFAESLQALDAALQTLRTPPAEGEGAATQDSAATLAETLAAQGLSWRYEPAAQSLQYAPHGHADPFLRAWIDLAAKFADPLVLAPDESGAQRDLGEQAIDELLAQFGRTTTAGRCLKCHTLEPEGDRLVVHWQSRLTSPNRQGFTKFVHGPHIVMLKEGDACKSCHVIDEDVAFFRPEYLQSGGLVNTDTASPACAGIGQIASTGSCVSCHHADGASQRCTTCHNYHVVGRSGGH